MAVTQVEQERSDADIASAPTATRPVVPTEVSGPDPIDVMGGPDPGGVTSIMGPADPGRVTSIMGA